jgi:hypothetical protein
MRPLEMTTPRRYRDRLFPRESDLTRAIRAALAAGIQSPRVEITRNGTISIISGEAPETTDRNPWLADFNEVKQ